MAKKVSIGNDMQGNLIQGNGNAIIQNDIDTQEISDAIYQTSNHEQEAIEKDKQEFSRKVLETMFVALSSAVLIGLFWENAFPFNAITAPFFVIATLLLSSVLRLTHFGVRQTIMRSVLLGSIYAVLLQFLGGLNDLMSINPFAGTAVFAIIGAVLGLIIGIILLFWKPLGD